MVKKAYVLAIVLLPILFQYSIGIATITVGDMFLIATTFFLVCTYRKNLKFHKFAILVLICIYISLLATTLRTGFSMTIMKTSLRYSLYIATIGFVPNVKTEKEFAMRKYIQIGVLTSTLLILQFVLISVFRIYLSGVIRWLPLTDETLYQYENIILGQKIKRCMSCFSEPSHFAIYAIGSAVVALFQKEDKKKNFLIAVYISIAVILSTSITGILVVGGVWICYMHTRFIRGKVHKRIIFLFGLVICSVMLLSLSPAAKYISNKDVFFKQAGGRTEGYSYVINNLKNISLTWYFGNGMNDIGTVVYLPGYARALYYFGVLGMLMFLLAFVVLKRRGWVLSNYLLLVVAVLNVATEIAFSSFILPYLLVIMLADEKKEMSQRIEECQ